MAYKDKPLKLCNVISLKITHLKYYGNRISLTYSSRPLTPPSLKRLVKAVGLRSIKTRCGATYAFEAAHPGVIFLGKKHISFDHLTKCETILETFEIDYSK